MFGCFDCAAPHVDLTSDGAPYLPTAGGELVVPVYNCGSSIADLNIEWDGTAVKGAEFVKTKSGLRLRIPVPAGVGSHQLSIVSTRRSSKAVGLTTVSYSPPAILRVAPLKTEGGDLVIIGEYVVKLL